MREAGKSTGRKGNAMKKEYVVYRMPNGDVITDWNETVWRFGYPAFPKCDCVELERGMCEGGMNLPHFAAEMKRKYNTVAE